MEVAIGEYGTDLDMLAEAAQLKKRKDVCSKASGTTGKY